MDCAELLHGMHKKGPVLLLRLAFFLAHAIQITRLIALAFTCAGRER